jgi:hypothetical protein
MDHAWLLASMDMAPASGRLLRAVATVATI